MSFRTRALPSQPSTADEAFLCAIHSNLFNHLFICLSFRRLVCERFVCQTKSSEHKMEKKKRESRRWNVVLWLSCTFALAPVILTYVWNATWTNNAVIAFDVGSGGFYIRWRLNSNEIKLKSITSSSRSDECEQKHFHSFFQIIPSTLVRLHKQDA